MLSLCTPALRMSNQLFPALSWKPNLNVTSKKSKIAATNNLKTNATDGATTEMATTYRKPGSFTKSNENNLLASSQESLKSTNGCTSPWQQLLLLTE